MHSDGLRTVTGLAAVATKPYKWHYSSSMPLKTVNAYQLSVAYECTQTVCGPSQD